MPKNDDDLIRAVEQAIKDAPGVWPNGPRVGLNEIRRSLGRLLAGDYPVLRQLAASRRRIQGR